MHAQLAIIGAGNLGQALAKGAIEKCGISPADVVLARRNLSKIEHWRHTGVTITQNNRQAAAAANMVILCVQPKQIATVLGEINEVLTESRHILISVATGVTTGEIAACLGGKPVPVVRAMPNTAVAIGQSMTCLCASQGHEHALLPAKQLFDALGQTLIIEERLMKAATVLAASGVAFFMRYIRAATQGGIQLGFDADDAQAIAIQTAKGAATLLQTNKSHPELEIDRVTTPEGCTIAGLNEMEHQGLSPALIKGIITSYEKINNIRQ
ncbi:MAG: pyrroline-5-carboxylate reductase [Cyclobacteriaceae bacterium]|nr:MAG: pyrroline-5-carboxylate reductase [Cyclobacteriaceae bacterium]